MGGGNHELVVAMHHRIFCTRFIQFFCNAATDHETIVFLTGSDFPTIAHVISYRQQWVVIRIGFQTTNITLFLISYLERMMAHVDEHTPVSRFVLKSTSVNHILIIILVYVFVKFDSPWSRIWRTHLRLGVLCLPIGLYDYIELCCSISILVGNYLICPNDRPWCASGRLTGDRLICDWVVSFYH